MTKIFYAVFDTNVLVSALLTKREDSPTFRLLDCVLDGRIVLLFNDDISESMKMCFAVSTLPSLLNAYRGS